MAFFEGIKMTGGYGNGPDIINSCSVDVNRGEIVSILGPNGAGKSTAMKAMLGLLDLKSGSVVIDGKDISITLKRNIDENDFSTDEDVRDDKQISIMKNKSDSGDESDFHDSMKDGKKNKKMILLKVPEELIKYTLKLEQKTKS